MTNTNTMTEKLITEFTENYMEKLFYFCLRKTGNSFEAEDLTSDIMLNILTALKKGVIPSSFSAWVWQIARNRYSVWADNRHRRLESVTGADISDYEIIDEYALIEDKTIRNEEMSLLRRELAFISSDYRNIIVAYYIEDKKVQDIAASLGLPEGTVKSKLFRARKILKEGMNMAREFGTLSYKPEDISFIMNGSDGMHGEPWSLLNHILYKNILLAAYRTPQTAEELSIELGIALPYMEDELNKLTEATLLKKNGDKYETNIFIISAAAQEKVYAHLRGLAPELTKAVIEATEYWINTLNKLSAKWHEGYQSYEDMKWALLMIHVNSAESMLLSEAEASSPYAISGYTIRPNNGRWDLLGLEDYKGDRPSFVGLHGCVDVPKNTNEVFDFGQFKFNYKRIADRTPLHLTFEEVKAIISVAKRHTEEVPTELLDRLVNYGYLRKSENTYKPTFLIMLKENLIKAGKEGITDEQLMKADAEHIRLLTVVKDIAMRHYSFCREQIYKEIPEFLKDDVHQIKHACSTLCVTRGAVLEEALRTGYISYNENDQNKMLGAYLML